MTPEDRVLLAGEFVLGLLVGDERSEAVRLSTDDPAFIADVALWERRFDGLYDLVPAVIPAADVWQRIEPRLASPEADTGERVAKEQPSAANDRGPAASAAPWKVAAAGFAALAAALAGVLVLRPDPAPVQPAPVIVAAPAEALVAQLNDGEGASMLAIRVGDDRSVVRVRATAIPAGAGEPELWVIPAGGAPRSLGLIGRFGESDVKVDSDVASLLIDGATLALTLEPRAGAPHAAPSGDILGTARITRL